MRGKVDRRTSWLWTAQATCGVCLHIWWPDTFFLIFPLLDLATAFKRLVQEKVTVEAVLKATTPLEDLSDIEALDSHLRNMNSKSELSMQEIRRLSDELRGKSYSLLLSLINPLSNHARDAQKEQMVSLT